MAKKELETQESDVKQTTKSYSEDELQTIISNTIAETTSSIFNRINKEIEVEDAKKKAKDEALATPEHLKKNIVKKHTYDAMSDESKSTIDSVLKRLRR